MSVQVACPACLFVVQRTSGESMPSHCPSCSARMLCPRCMSPLSRGASETALFHCSTCNAVLVGDETGLLDEPLPAEGRDVPPRVPGFEVVGRIGKGGMGLVWRARQETPVRDVALKVLPANLVVNTRLLARFREEANAVAGLTHAHILPILAVAEDESGAPVLVLPLIDGCDLGRLVKERIAARQGRFLDKPNPLALANDRTYLDAILPLVDQLVEAVAALNAAEVLHRDIKPSNALTDGHGHLWLSDFGLARREGRQRMTDPGTGLGTAFFASPEQARGDEIDARADVFSLAASIYQLVSLEYPFGQKGAKNATRPCVPPSRRQPLLSKDYDAVLLKALELNSRERYVDTKAFLEDWKAVRERRLPKARLAGPVARLRRAAWRNPARVAAGCLGLLLAAALPFALARNGAAPATSPVQVKRTVHLETDPPGARSVFVPLHEENGTPLIDQAVQPDTLTPLTVDLPPGMYVIEVEKAGHGFQEVFRLIPRPGEEPLLAPTRNFLQSWNELPDSSIQLKSITIPGHKALEGMAFFGDAEFFMGSAENESTPPWRRKVQAYYLDTTEVTVKAYRDLVKSVPQPPSHLKHREPWPPPDCHAVTWVNYWQALAFAEDVGKRIPDEAEYERAATDAGKRRFPWGDNAEIKQWPIGLVAQPVYDKTDTIPPVYGLFSNVLEWTTSWYMPYPTSDPALILYLVKHPDIKAERLRCRVVRGGAEPVCTGDPDPAGKDRNCWWNPRNRFGTKMDWGADGIGFRCARSAEPRYLHR